jgi:hypothetical protein
MGWRRRRFRARGAVAGGGRQRGVHGEHEGALNGRGGRAEDGRRRKAEAPAAAHGGGGVLVVDWRR